MIAIPDSMVWIVRHLGFVYTPGVLSRVTRQLKTYLFSVV